MDSDGGAAQVIFAGGQNDTELPWVGLGFNAGPNQDSELRQAIYRIWNRWISEYTSTAPDRLIGVMQVPIWDVDAAIREVEWCAARGLRVVNLHAPRDDYPAYTELIYEPFWASCEDIGATLATHAGASTPYGGKTRRQKWLIYAENHWFGNRGLAQLIFGGVFERYPGLRYVLTEQRVDFAPMLVRHLDSIYDNHIMQTKMVDDEPRGGLIWPGWPIADPSDPEPLMTLKRPSEYWRDHCYLSGSFLAQFEVALRFEVGVSNLMWGSDYPHCEGTWPDTRLALRHTFANVPADEARLVLGETAIDVYNLSRPVLRAVANRIGPRPEELSEPVTAEELPDARSWAFRREGNFA
jgi:predicted TIM-barrel fold metal-dependent hydrolase